MNDEAEDLRVSKLTIEGGSPCLGLLDLDNFSICQIISILDFKEFSAFSKTCKRINSLSADRYSWKSTVLFRRISYLIQDAWFEGWYEGSRVRNFKNYPSCSLTRLMRIGVDLGQTLSVLNQAMVKRIWDSAGPFATKLFSNLKDYTVEEVHSQPQADWLIERRNYNFKFESEKLLIQISLLRSDNKAIEIQDGYVESSEDEGDDDDDDGDDIGWAPVARDGDEYIKKLISLTSQKYKIKAFHNGNCILIYKSDSYEESHTRKITDVEDIPISSDLQSFSRIAEVITRNLPETNIPLRSEYLLDLLLSFPNKAEFIDVPQLKFIDDDENKEPRGDIFHEKLIAQRKIAIESYHNNANKFIFESMKKKDLGEELVLHLGTLLEKNPSMFINVDRCFHMSAKAGFDLLFANDMAIRALVRRFNFDKSSKNEKGQDEDFRNCEFSMRLPGDQSMRVECSWEMDLTPGMASKIILSYHFYRNDEYFHHWDTEAVLLPTEHFETLECITKIFKDCLQSDLESEYREDMLTNKVTAKFLLGTVKGLLKGLRSFQF